MHAKLTDGAKQPSLMLKLGEGRNKKAHKANGTTSGLNFLISAVGYVPSFFYTDAAIHSCARRCFVALSYYRLAPVISRTINGRGVPEKVFAKVLHARELRSKTKLLVSWL